MSAGKGKLSYDRQEPAFLRRLRGEATSDSTDKDRHQFATARPKRAKVDEEDDAPTYVIEESNDTVSKAEYEALLTGKAAETVSKGKGEVLDAHGDPVSGNGPLAEDSTQRNQQVQDIGKAPRKRKAIKVVGDEESDLEESSKTSAPAKKTKKKAKPVKLSFEDD